jgi:hypothetical protein
MVNIGTDLIETSPALIQRLRFAHRFVASQYLPSMFVDATHRTWRNDDLYDVDSNGEHPLWWFIGPLALDLFGEDHPFERAVRARHHRNSLVMVPPAFAKVTKQILRDLSRLDFRVQHEQRKFTKQYVSLIYGGYPWFESYLRVCDARRQFGATCHLIYVQTDSRDAVAALKEYKTRRRGDLGDSIRVACPDLEHPGLMRAFHTPSHIENIRHVRASREA